MYISAGAVVSVGSRCFFPEPLHPWRRHGGRWRSATKTF